MTAGTTECGSEIGKVPEEGKSEEGGRTLFLESEEVEGKEDGREVD